MTYAVRLSGQAEKDLNDIFDYVAVDLQNPIAAEGLLSRLEKSILNLDQMPLRCRLYNKEPWKSRGLRVLSVENYLVYYVPDQDAATVTVIRVLYGGRDIDKVLNDT